MIALARVGIIRLGGPRCALIHPGPQQSDLFGGQPSAFGRHDQVFIEPGDQLDQPAFGAATGQDYLARERPGQGRGPMVQAQIPALFGRAVTLDAGSLEDRLNVRNEIDGPIRGGGQGLADRLAHARSDECSRDHTAECAFNA